MEYKNPDQDTEITSVDPLNLALGAKTKSARTWWWFITIADVVALIYAMTLLILKYQNSQTNAVIHLKRNQAPFPAVTFCNMNPYKRSALKKIPELANLIDQFTNASKSNDKITVKADANSDNESSLSKNRHKRTCVPSCGPSNPVPAPSSCCTSSNTPLVAVQFDSSAYYRCNKAVDWASAWTCCANNPPTGFAFTSSRLARTDSEKLIDFLFDKSVVTSGDAWCGMSGTQTPPIDYFWYDTSTKRSSSDKINLPNICSTCKQFDPTWNTSGGAVVLQKTATDVVFDCWPASFSRSYSYICEYLNATAITTTVSTTSNTRSSSPSTSTSTSTSAISSPTSTATSPSTIVSASVSTALTAASTSTRDISSSSAPIASSSSPPVTTATATASANETRSAKSTPTPTVASSPSPSSSLNPNPSPSLSLTTASVSTLLTVTSNQMSTISSGITPTSFASSPNSTTLMTMSTKETIMFSKTSVSSFATQTSTESVQSSTISALESKASSIGETILGTSSAFASAASGAGLELSTTATSSSKATVEVSSSPSASLATKTSATATARTTQLASSESTTIARFSATSSKASQSTSSQISSDSITPSAAMSTTTPALSFSATDSQSFTATVETFSTTESQSSTETSKAIATLSSSAALSSQAITATSTLPVATTLVSSSQTFSSIAFSAFTSPVITSVTAKSHVDSSALPSSSLTALLTSDKSTIISAPIESTTDTAPSQMSTTRVPTALSQFVTSVPEPTSPFASKDTTMSLPLTTDKESTKVTSFTASSIEGTFSKSTSGLVETSGISRFTSTALEYNSAAPVQTGTATTSTVQLSSNPITTVTTPIIQDPSSSSLSQADKLSTNYASTPTVSLTETSPSTALITASSSLSSVTETTTAIPTVFRSCCTDFSTVLSTDRQSVTVKTFTSSVTTDNQISTDQGFNPSSKTLASLSTIASVFVTSSTSAIESSSALPTISAATVSTTQSFIAITSPPVPTAPLSGFSFTTAGQLVSTILSNSATSKLLISSTPTTLTSVCPSPTTTLPLTRTSSLSTVLSSSTDVFAVTASSTSKRETITPSAPTSESKPTSGTTATLSSESTTNASSVASSTSEASTKVITTASSEISSTAESIATSNVERESTSPDVTLFSSALLLTATESQSILVTTAPTVSSSSNDQASSTELASTLKVPTAALAEGTSTKAPSTIALHFESVSEKSSSPFETALVSSPETSTDTKFVTSMLPTSVNLVTSFVDAPESSLALSSNSKTSLFISDKDTAIPDLVSGFSTDVATPQSFVASFATTQSLDKTSTIALEGIKTSELTLEDIKTSVLLETIGTAKSSETTSAASFTLNQTSKSMSDAADTSSTIAYASTNEPKYDDTTSVNNATSTIQIANNLTTAAAIILTSEATSTASSLIEDMPTETSATTPFDSVSTSSSEEPTTAQVASTDLETEQSTELTSLEQEFRATSFPLPPPLTTKEKATLQAPSTPFPLVERNSLFDTVKDDASALSITMEDAIPYIMASLPEDEKEKAGFALSELLMRCIYNGVRCSFSDFQLKIDPGYGNCYTFNYDGNYTIGSRVGASSGLSVTYNTQNSEYLDYLQMTGVRVVVHEKGEPIFPNVMGFDVPSGYQSSTSLSKVQISSDPLVKSCAYFGGDVPVYYYNNATIYSTEACIRSCYQNNVIKVCQCGDPRVPLPNDERFQYCTLSNRDCVNENYDTSAGDNCNCPPACLFVNHEITQTNTKWAISYGKNLQWSTFDGSSQSDFDKNELARIDVYYQTLDVTEYVETMLYSWSDLMWQLSSIIGLALGISVISLFEIIHLEEWCRKKCQA